MILTEEENRASDAIVDAMHAIQDMGLKYNEEEMVAAIHVLQSFVKQHVLNRLDPVLWNDWFGENDDSQVG